MQEKLKKAKKGKCLGKPVEIFTVKIIIIISSLNFKI